MYWFRRNWHLIIEENRRDSGADDERSFPYWLPIVPAKPPASELSRSMQKTKKPNAFISILTSSHPLVIMHLFVLQKDVRRIIAGQ